VAGLGLNSCVLQWRLGCLLQKSSPNKFAYKLSSSSYLSNLVSVGQLSFLPKQGVL
jgi:hypothetical protein